MGNFSNLDFRPDITVTPCDNSEEERRFKRNKEEEPKKKQENDKVKETVIKTIQSCDMEELIRCLKNALLNATKESDNAKLIEILILAEKRLKECNK